MEGVRCREEEREKRTLSLVLSSQYAARRPRDSRSAAVAVNLSSVLTWAKPEGKFAAVNLTRSFQGTEAGRWVDGVTAAAAVGDERPKCGSTSHCRDLWDLGRLWADRQMLPDGCR